MKLVNSGTTFDYNCEFEGIANTSLPIQNVQELTWCCETLEAYRLTICFDYPDIWMTPMSSIEILIGGAQASLNWQATNGKS